jgi:ankyrin repeat protein
MEKMDDILKKKVAEFQFSAEVGDLAGMKRIAKKSGFPIDAKNGSGMTALAIASGEGHHEVVAWLLDVGADVDSSDENGWTPAMAAAYTGFPDCLKLLLGKGCDVSRSGKDGRTALMLAVDDDVGDGGYSYDKRNMSIDLLYLAGSDWAAVNARGQKAEDIARQNGWSMWVDKFVAERERSELGCAVQRAAGPSSALRV